MTIPTQADRQRALEAMKDMTVDAQTNKIRVLLSISEHNTVTAALSQPDHAPGDVVSGLCADLFFIMSCTEEGHRQRDFRLLAAEKRIYDFIRTAALDSQKGVEAVPIFFLDAFNEILIEADKQSRKINGGSFQKIVDICLLTMSRVKDGKIVKEKSDEK